MFRPIIAVSMGDPFGNGAEVTVKAFSHADLFDRCRPIVIGDAACLERAAVTTGTGCRINPVKSVSDACFTPGVIDVLDMGLICGADLPPIPSRPAPMNVGPCEKGGEAGFSYVKKVIGLALAGEADATVTNAISKEAINMAGHHFSGHTEIYAEFTHTAKYSMMLAHDSLRVVHVSTHVSLREACDRVKTPRVLEVIRIADAACRALGIAQPKIAVAGLNPHCGEGGLFGTEEAREIQPAIDIALAEGINIPDKKPLPPDTVFSKALGGWYDIVVAMYHDQGHIPLKVKGFVYNREEGHWESVSGVNITLGLPIIRTSVDHGTGFDIAGDGSASDLSLVNAIDYAIAMAKTRRRA